MKCIGKEFVRHEFRFTPAKGKGVNIYRETYKCLECARSEENPDNQMFVKTPVQESLILENYASESVVAWAMHRKYQNGLPLKRQETDSWMWLFHNGEDELPPILLYHYTETRAKFHAVSF